ncbi:MAG: quinone-dependent dihydroorotate dehydrogenase [Hyphomicrobiales bacterium]
MNGLFSLARPFLRTVDAETAHWAGLTALKTGFYPADRSPDPESLKVKLFGLEFPNPIGVAAGFDKNGEVPDACLDLGFGFAEVGTVTPRPQPGNPKPRIFRLYEDNAVINRLGFNNEGHDAVFARLSARKKTGITGINIGANKTSSDMIADYEAGVRLFAPLASYLTVNISSPNTPGLSGLQERSQLENLVGRVTGALAETIPEGERKPALLVKIAPDLIDEELQDIAEVVLAGKIDGVIVSNTTIARPGLLSSKKSETGGLSGAPLFDPSTRMLARFHQATSGKIPLIGVGGVHSAVTAWEKFRAGASLVQLYTGMVFEGPDLAVRIKNGLADKLRLEKHDSISEIIASGVKEWAQT